MLRHICSTTLQLLLGCLSLVADPGKGGAEQGQGLAGACGALQEGVLALVQGLHHSVHVLDLATVWLKWEVDSDARNFNWNLTLDDFLFFHYKAGVKKQIKFELLLGSEESGQRAVTPKWQSHRLTRIRDRWDPRPRGPARTRTTYLGLVFQIFHSRDGHYWSSDLFLQ